jgi:di/tricarboxylate transporter
VIAGMFIALVRELAQPEAILLGALVSLLFTGVLTPEQAFAGLSNAGVLTVGAFFVISAAIQKTGALRFAFGLMFPSRPTVRGARYRLMLFTAGVSAFINNTPVVAMLVPHVQAWCAKHNVAPSRLMMPLSYAAILGGMTTLIGTSTNLLVSGLMQEAGHPPLGMFTITVAGLPAALAAVLFFMWLGYRALPHYGVAGARGFEDLQHTLFEVRVPENSSVSGLTIEELGLRNLGEAFIVHIRRGREIVPASPDRRLYPGDVMSLSGNASVLERLRILPTIEAGDRDRQAATPLPLFEAVVAPGSSLVGKTLQEAKFRTRFDGVVLGIHRRDEKLTGALGQTLIRPGDLLIIEARPGFDQRWSENDDEFFLVAPYRGQPAPFRPERAAVALTTLGGIVLAGAFDLVPIVTAAFAGAGIVIATGCVTMREARRSINVKLLVMIAAALGIGKAVEITGIADALAGWMVTHVAFMGPVGAIAGVYLATAIVTEILTNNAAAALMISIGLSAARQLGVPPEAFAVTVAIAASASFITPIGYQTNLMVMSAGGYRFADYLRAGLPVSLLVGGVTVAAVYLAWL